jgi:coenzyme PQQ biosynthesis protein PqqD
VRSPRLVTGARLRYDEVREEHLLLVPEGAVRLNPSAAEVLALCDGEHSLVEIVGVLTSRYDGTDVDADVRDLVDAMVQKGLLVDAAA